MTADPKAAVPIVFADTETTDIGHRRLAWELGMIRREPDGTRSELQAFIEVDLSDANPYALKVGRFYDRHPLGRWLASGPARWEDIGVGPTSPSSHSVVWDGVPGAVPYFTQQQAALAWCRWTHGAHVVGAVPSFDTEVMGWAARAAGLLGGHHYHLTDAENLLAGYLRGRVTFDPTLPDEGRAQLDALSRPPWDSDALFAAVDVTTPDEDRHTALGDARTVERVWDALYGGGRG